MNFETEQQALGRYVHDAEDARLRADCQTCREPRAAFVFGCVYEFFFAFGLGSLVGLLTVLVQQAVTP